MEGGEKRGRRSGGRVGVSLTYGREGGAEGWMTSIECTIIPERSIVRKRGEA